MTGDLPEGLLEYFAIRDRQHADNVSVALAAMSDRERLLVREAAVVAFVRGSRYGAVHGIDAEVPNDTSIVAGVVDACLAMADLYPTMASLRGDV